MKCLLCKYKMMLFAPWLKSNWSHQSPVAEKYKVVMTCNLMLSYDGGWKRLQVEYAPWGKNAAWSPSRSGLDWRLEWHHVLTLGWVRDYPASDGQMVILQEYWKMEVFTTPLDASFTQHMAFMWFTGRISNPEDSGSWILRITDPQALMIEDSES